MKNLLCVCALCLALTGHAEQTVPFDPLELESSIDEVMVNAMRSSGVPGASLAVVSNGRVVLAKGYGVADAARGTPVTGDTPFRIASLSKLFTATAVMQLATSGQLSLHTNIGDYLAVPLRTDFDVPVTAHHLMTHTSGFEITDIGDAAQTADQVLTLEELVRWNMVGQSHAPGEIYAYSNHGFALLGLAIEATTGLSFDAALDELVLRPLNMNRSSFAQPLPETIRKDISLSYSSNLTPLKRDYSQVGPADALDSTANDMALFMIAQLEGHPAWGEDVLTTMQAQQYAPYPTRYGMAYAWHESTLRGHRVLEHSGGQLGFASYIAIIPEEKFGYFIVQNMREGSLRALAV